MAIKSNILLPKRRRRRRRIRETGSDLIFNVVNYALLCLVLIIVLYPLIYITSASFSAPSAVVAGKVRLLPVDFSLTGYKKVFAHKAIWKAFANSLFYTGVGTLVNVIMTILAAYPLSRKDLYGRNFLMALFFFTMLFGGGLIPFYLVVQRLGLLNTRWALIIPVALSVWNLFITMTYFRTSIPQELFDAAQLDGCSDIRYLISVVLPLSRPIIAVLFLFYAVGHWNQYFLALILLKDRALYPLQLVLREILVLSEIDFSMIGDVETMAMVQGLKEQLKYTLITVTSIPVLMLYPFVQRHFIKGLTLGSLKG
jgi:putative aldouronate transport system permease protein